MLASVFLASMRCGNKVLPLLILLLLLVKYVVWSSTYHKNTSDVCVVAGLVGSLFKCTCSSFQLLPSCSGFCLACLIGCEFLCVAARLVSVVLHVQRASCCKSRTTCSVQGFCVAFFKRSSHVMRDGFFRGSEKFYFLQLKLKDRNFLGTNEV